MNKRLKVVLIILAVMTCGGAYHINNLQKENNTLKEQIYINANKIGKLESNIQELNDNLAETDKKIDQLSSMVSELKEEIE